MNPVSKPLATEIPSPCVGTCRIREADQRCEGCERTLDEIARWQAMDATTRQALLEELRGRRRASADQAGSEDGRSLTGA